MNPIRINHELNPNNSLLQVKKIMIPIRISHEFDPNQILLLFQNKNDFKFKLIILLLRINHE